MVPFEGNSICSRRNAHKVRVWSGAETVNLWNHCVRNGYWSPIVHPTRARLVLTFGLFLPVLVVRSQVEVLPPIFAPRPDAHIAPSQPKRSSLLSDVTRKRISEVVLVNTEVFGARPMATPEIHRVVEDSLLMQPYIVRSAPIRAITLPAAESPALRFLRTGTLFYRAGAKVDTHIKLDVLLLQETGPHRNEEFSRFELQFTFRF